MTTNFDPTVWGPHFWFFLHTVSMTYPTNPNDSTKKKYYDLVTSLPLFIPVKQIAGDFSNLLDQYPITPYLDNRESLIRWTWFIHNKINAKLEKPQITLNEFYVTYYNAYKPKNAKMIEHYKLKEKIIYGGVIVTLVGSIYYLYDK